MNKTHFFRSAVPLAVASLFIQTIGCASHAAIPPASQPIFTSAEIKVVPPPAPAPMVAVSPNVSASADLIAACKLDFNDIDNAPKFDFAESDLIPQDNAILSQIAKCVTTGPLGGSALDVVGRADPRGGPKYNLKLGDRRANSVADYLSGLGVNSSKLAVSSRGKLDATGTDESGWQRDRRVDISLH